MNKIKRVLINIIVASGWICIIISGFMAYFVSSYDEVNKVYVDGLGRELSEAPFLAKIFLLGSDSWSGLNWMVIEYIIFYGFLALTIILLKQKEKFKL